MIPSGQTTIGRLIRLPLRLVPTGAWMRILSGVNRGRKWRVGALTHGCWIGTYERDKQRALRSIVRPGMNALDIGANAGFYSLALSSLCGPSGHVWAFEPLPDNLRNLGEHLQANGVTNVTIVPAAASDTCATARFAPGGNDATGRLCDSGSLVVPTLTLDSLIRTGVFPIPDVVKMDVEGAEDRVLDGARDLLQARRTTWMIALHGAVQDRRCHAMLAQYGYTVAKIGRPDELLATPGAPHLRGGVPLRG